MADTLQAIGADARTHVRVMKNVGVCTKNFSLGHGPSNPDLYQAEVI